MIGKTKHCLCPDCVVGPRESNSRQKMNSVEPCGFGTQHGKADRIESQASFQNSRFGRHTSTSGLPEPPR